MAQQIHSLRASGVISSHFVRAAGSETSAFRKSAGTLWTTPVESLFDMPLLYPRNLTAEKVSVRLATWFLEPPLAAGAADSRTR
jgi:hypothetical protein